MKIILYVLDGCQVGALSQVGTPEARELEKRALIYTDAQTIYPSLTGPGHASILTGVRPTTHGLISHMYWDREGGSIKNIYSDSAFESPTLFELLSQRGVKSLGHGNYFRRGIADTYSRRALKWLANRLEGSATISSAVDAMPFLERFVKRKVAGTLEGVDEKIADSSENVHYVVDNHVDKSSHKYGPTSTQYFKSIEEAMSNILELLNTLDSRRQEYTVIVTSDHGHTSVDNKLTADALDLKEVGYPLREAKLLNSNLVVFYGGAEITAVSVVVSRHIQVYLKDKSKIGRVREALLAKPFIDRLLVGGEIDEYGAGNRRTGDIIGSFKENIGFAELPIGEKGDHGGFTEDEMRVPLWLISTRINPGTKRGGATVDIAPTVYSLLGLSLNGERFHGEPLRI
ncbi:MAG: alkaline phosphatase family protein [Thermoprotei archaeon]